jgi:hypothetical protein
MTLPDPYRGYAAPTWDTKTLASLIAALGGVGAAAPAASHNHAGAYPPSALVNYLETNNGDGTNTMQTIASGTPFKRLNVAGTVSANPGGGFDAGTDVYTIPGGGIYICQALVRIKDGTGGSFNFGIGWHTSEDDGYWFQWNKYFTGAGGRCSFDYTRVAAFGVGNQCRLYCFQDSGNPVDLTAVNLSVWRIA